MKRNLSILALASLLLLALALAAPPELSFYAVTSGGGRNSAGIYTQDSAIGQHAVGVIVNGVTEVCAGFLCGDSPDLRVYMPLLRR